MDDLTPLTLRQKAANKRLNKTVDRIANIVTAVGITVIAYGGIRETFDPSAPGGTRLLTVVASVAIGLAMCGASSYLAFRLHRRED